MGCSVTSRPRPSLHASVDPPSARHVVLSGCSGGGKSTLLAELARRGHAIVAEPGRRIVEEELRSEGGALPWVNPAAFAARALAVAADDRARAPTGSGWTFFDRGLVDAALALQHAAGQPASVTLAPFAPYHDTVFMTPPWPEIHVADRARRHGMDAAIAEYDRLLIGYRALGYETVILPKTSVEERARFVLRRIGSLPEA